MFLSLGAHGNVRYWRKADVRLIGRPNIAVILASGELGKATAVTKPFNYGSATSRIHAAILKKITPT